MRRIGWKVSAWLVNRERPARLVRLARLALQVLLVPMAGLVRLVPLARLEFRGKLVRLDLLALWVPPVLPGQPGPQVLLV